MTTKKVRRHVQEHPAEYGAVSVYATLTALLTAFGLDADKAAAIAGAVAAITPAVLTYLRNRGWI